MKKIILPFLFVLSFGGSSYAGDLYLGCSGSMRSSVECEQALHIFLSRVDCHVKEMNCQQIDPSGFEEGYDCSAQSDICESPFIDDSGETVCPEPERFELISGDGNIFGDLFRMSGEIRFADLLNSRNTAERWEASATSVCRLRR